MRLNHTAENTVTFTTRTSCVAGIGTDGTWSESSHLLSTFMRKLLGRIFLKFGLSTWTECSKMEIMNQWKSILLSFYEHLFFRVLAGCIHFVGVVRRDWWRCVKKKGKDCNLQINSWCSFFNSLRTISWKTDFGARDLGHRTNRLSTIKLYNRLIVLLYTPPCISLCLFMKNNPLSLLIPMLLLIQLLALLCYTLAYCMHSYTPCSSEQTVSSLRRIKFNNCLWWNKSAFLLFSSHILLQGSSDLFWPLQDTLHLFAQRIHSGLIYWQLDCVNCKNDICGDSKMKFASWVTYVCLTFWVS